MFILIGILIDILKPPPTPPQIIQKNLNENLLTSQLLAPIFDESKQTSTQPQSTVQNKCEDEIKTCQTLTPVLSVEQIFDQSIDNSSPEPNFLSLFPSQKYETQITEPECSQTTNTPICLCKICKV